MHLERGAHDDEQVRAAQMRDGLRERGRERLAEEDDVGLDEPGALRAPRDLALLRVRLVELGGMHVWRSR